MLLCPLFFFLFERNKLAGITRLTLFQLETKGHGGMAVPLWQQQPIDTNLDLIIFISNTTYHRTGFCTTRFSPEPFDTTISHERKGDSIPLRI